MRVVKTYETFIGKKVPVEFDPNFAMAKIKHFYSEYDVKNLVDEEIEELVDDSNLSSGNYETKREWYDQFGNGEAEELVAERLADWYESEWGKELSEEEKELIVKTVLDEKTGYDSLQH